MELQNPQGSGRRKGVPFVATLSQRNSRRAIEIFDPHARALEDKTLAGWTNRHVQPIL
jgi:hypothetical protein